MIKFRSLIYKYLWNVIDFVFPVTCVGCEKGGEYICISCRQKLIPHQEFCNICHKPSDDFVVHRMCRDKVYYEGIVILWEFTSLVKKIIYKLKFFHRYNTVEFLAQKLWIWIQTNWVLAKVSEKAESIYISYVPSHWWRRYWVKWYNQSELLAHRLSEISWISFLDIWSKIKNTKSQVKLSRRERLLNLVGVYRLWDSLTLSGSETIIIVDDISTTWSTINQLAKTIKERYENVMVRWIVLARSNK